MVMVMMMMIIITNDLLIYLYNSKPNILGPINIDSGDDDDDDDKDCKYTNYITTYNMVYGPPNHNPIRPFFYCLVVAKIP